jgi:group I intron endonuclease
MTIGVYLILNRASGSFYIGSSAVCEERMRRHVWSLRKGEHPCRRLQHSWSKHGESSFEFGVIISCFTVQAALDYEQALLNEHHGTARCLNASRFASSPLWRGQQIQSAPIRTPEQIAAYKLEWSRKNRDLLRSRHKQWRDANPEKLRANLERYKSANPDAVRESKRAWEARNLERAKQMKRDYEERKRMERRMAG